MTYQINPNLQVKDQEGWDEYWREDNAHAPGWYGPIAEFYRTKIIRQALNHFIHKNFSPHSQLLVAGCGGGQVDWDVVRSMKVTALDISVPALNRYQELNGSFCQLLHGSIMEIPGEAHAFDGIYNLGVMEHFTESEINSILSEFHRVLRPNGKLVLFWPPEYGLSVAAFKVIYFVMNSILKKNIKLCPDEITRLRSRKHAESILNRSGFEVLEYYFGPRDLFTHSIVVAQKID